jgi:hypothetical protein
VNSIWPWGEASIATEHATRLIANAGRRSTPAPRLLTWEVPGWLGALAHTRLDQPGDALGAVDGDTLLVCGNVAAPAIAADWDGWLRAMQQLEAELFAPLLDAVRAGRIARLRIVPTHRDGHLDTITTPMAQRKFWRRPTLEALI